MRKPTLLFALLWIPVALSAQSPLEPNEGCQIQVSHGAGRFSWWARSGRTYFLQQTTSLSAPWNYLPVIEPGDDSVKHWDFASDAESAFFRLQYSEIPSADPLGGDFDGDWIGNLAEITQGTDPLLAADADATGIPDDWERANAGMFAAWPPVLSAALPPQAIAAKTIVLRNDTDAAVAFTFTLGNNAPPVYRCENSPVQPWEEISATGTRLSVVSDADDDFERVDFGSFRFPFFGELQTSVFVSSNGLLTFGAGSSARDNTTLPSTAAPGALIAPFWADLDASSGGDVFCREEADRFIIQFQNINHYDGDGTYTFQVVLFRDGRIQLHYRSLIGVLHGPTAGIQDATGTLGLRIPGTQVAGESVVVIHPNSPFLVMPVTSGTLAPHSTLPLEARFQSLGLPPGLYTASISANHNGTAGPNPALGSATLEVLHPDPDGDGMPTLFESAHGLDPARYDALDDNDGDRFPNIVEFTKGTLPEEAGSQPQADFTVAPEGGKTINEVIGALTEEWQIIEALPGDYDQTVWLDSPHKVLLISRDGPFSTRLRNSNPAYAWEVVGIYGSCVLDGFTITTAPGVRGQGLYVNSGPTRVANCVISGITASESAARSLGGGAGIVVDGDAGLLLVNCIVRDCFQASVAPSLATNGAALFVTGGTLEVENCTFVQCGYWHSREPMNGAVVLTGGTASIRRSVLWNNQGSQIEAGNASLTVERSLVRGGWPGTGIIDADPGLISNGRLPFRSPCKDAAGSATRVRNDIDGQPRPAGKEADIGADELVDTDWNADGDPFSDAEELSYGTDPQTPDSNTDGDALPDSFELAAFGNLSRTEASSQDGDSMADAWEIVRLGNLDQGDSDHDGLPDGWETTHGLNPADDDALEDFDGDRFPNLVELLRETSPSDPSSRPMPDFVVGPAGSGAPYSSIAQAAGELSSDWQIIEVLPGNYTGPVHLARANVVLLSHGGPFSTTIRPDTADEWEALGIHGRAVVDGFTINRTGAPHGLGIYVGGQTRVRARVNNCVVTGCRQPLSDALEGSGLVVQHADLHLGNVILHGNQAASGAAIFAEDAGLRADHCTFFGNTAGSGDSVYAVDSAVAISNSILWNSGAVETLALRSSLEIGFSNVRGGFPGTGNLAVAPSLDATGRLNFRSPGTNAAGASPSRWDIDGDARPWKGAPDMGADEMVDLALDRDGDNISNAEEILFGSNPDLPEIDSDGDQLADLNELAWFGDLGRAPSTDRNANSLPDAWEMARFGSLNNLASDDADNDGFSNQQELAAGSDPMDFYNASIPNAVLFSDVIHERAERDGFTKTPVDPADPSPIDFYATATLTAIELNPPEDVDSTVVWSATWDGPAEFRLWERRSGGGRFNPISYFDFDVHEDPAPLAAGFKLSVVLSNYVPVSYLTDKLNEFAAKEFTGKYVPFRLMAWRDTNLRKTSCEYAKSRYVVRFPPSPYLPKIGGATWYIEEWKQDENEQLGEIPDNIVWLHRPLEPGASFSDELIPPNSDSAEGWYRWGYIGYFQIHADLDRDGEFSGPDAKLKWDGLDPAATSETKLAGTEILVAVPDNGQEPTNELAPGTDVKRLKLWSGFYWGQIRLRHPAIDKLGFYRTAECKESDRISFPFNLENENFRNFPGTVFVRVDKELQETVTGNLVMEFIDRGAVRMSDELPLTLVPAEPMVDGDRDGNMSLEDAVVRGRDRTSPSRPYRFWINNDRDGDSEDLPVNGVQDCNSSFIYKQRDLEDFTRLWVSFKGLTHLLGRPGLSVEIAITPIEGNPSIRLFAHNDRANGYGTGYLTDDSIAKAQLATLEDQVQVGPAVRPGQPLNLASSAPKLIASLSEENPALHFLFEGVTPGKAKLLVTIKKEGHALASLPEVFLDLKEIKGMYERHNVLPVHQQVSPAFLWPPSRFEPAPEEQPDAIIFVHGWQMSPEGASRFAETMFKRLWWRGFKGRFVAVRWPTHYSSVSQWPVIGNKPVEVVLANYNASEYTAWGCGPELSRIVNALPAAYTRHLAAHSMGNIVAGSALLNGMMVTNYALLQGAVPAACYDESEALRQTPKQVTVPLLCGTTMDIELWDEASPDDDPDPETRQLAYRGRLRGVSGNLINFCLPNDYATSYAWALNNDLTKPPSALLSGPFRYDRDGQPGKKLFSRFETGDTAQNVYFRSDNWWEAQAFACRTWGRAVGAEVRTRGSVKEPVDLDSKFKFDQQHSAEFNGRIQMLTGFYDLLLNEFDIEVAP